MIEIPPTFSDLDSALTACLVEWTINPHGDATKTELLNRKLRCQSMLAELDRALAQAIQMEPPKADVLTDRKDLLETELLAEIAKIDVILKG